MGQIFGTKQVPPSEPKVPIKDLVKDYTKQIQRTRREFRRQTMKFQMNDRQYKAQLQKKIKNGDSMHSKRVLAQNILRNQRYAQKYANLDAQLQGMVFQLNTMAATATMTDVMTKMTEIMKKTNSASNVKDIQMAMMKFENENQRANVLNEMIEDALTGTDQEIEDQDADKLIRDMEDKGSGNGMGVGKVEREKKEQKYPQFDEMMKRIDKI